MTLSVYSPRFIFDSISRQAKFHNPPVIAAKQENRTNKKKVQIFWVQFSLLITIRNLSRITNRLEKKHFHPEILFFRFTLFEASPLPRSRSCVAPFHLYWDEKKMCTRDVRRDFSFFIKFFWDQVYTNFIQFKILLE